MRKPKHKPKPAQPKQPRKRKASAPKHARVLRGKLDKVYPNLTSRQRAILLGKTEWLTLQGGELKPPRQITADDRKALSLANEVRVVPSRTGPTPELTAPDKPKRGRRPAHDWPAIFKKADKLGDTPKLGQQLRAWALTKFKGIAPTERAIRKRLQQRRAGPKGPK